jgi:hypothetical protein
MELREEIGAIELGPFKFEQKKQSVFSRDPRVIAFGSEHQSFAVPARAAEVASIRRTGNFIPASATAS